MFKNQFLKFTSIIVIALSIVSCNNDDDSTQEENGIEVSNFYGNWKPISETTVCSTGEEFTEELSDCRKSSNLIFSSSGNMGENFYDTNEYGECTLFFSYNGTYSISENSFEVNAYDTTSTQIIFELTEDTLKFGTYEEDEYDCGTNGTIEYTYTTYTKADYSN